MDQSLINQIRNAYVHAPRRFIFTDYDGVLVGFASTPQAAKPTPELSKLLAALGADPKNSVVIVSGRSKANLQEWFGDLQVFLSAEHGHFMRHPGGQWQAATKPDDSWKTQARPILHSATRTIPNSFIEEKETALVWHYRQAKVPVDDTLAKLTNSLQGLSLLPGSKVLEVRLAASTSKAAIFGHFIIQPKDFVLVIGDDVTDEAMFAAAPEQAFTVKVRPGKSRAEFRIATYNDTRDLLRALVA